MSPSQTKFRADLAAGEKGERHVANALKKFYGALKCSRIGACKGFDFRLMFEDREELFEVKTDFKAKNTGNLFFEYKCSGKDSGLLSTQADKWAVLLPHLQVILVFCPKRMLAYLRKSPKARRIIGGDRKAVEGFIIPLRFLINKAGIEAIFTKTRLTDREKSVG